MSLEEVVREIRKRERSIIWYIHLLLEQGGLDEDTRIWLVDRLVYYQKLLREDTQ